MIYRIVATILLLLTVCAVGVALEYEEPTSNKARPVPAATPDDSAMKSLRIN